jgi:Tfp pilus assembly protein PilN
MFTIDLLKGQGIPVKSGPGGVTIAVVALVVPIVTAIVMFGFYLSNIVNISVQKQEVVRYEKQIDELSDALEMQKSFEEKKTIYSNNLSEVSSSIGRHTQWSPVLEVLLKSMPDSMILTRLEVKQDFVKKKVPQKEDPKKMTDISIPVRTLRIDVCGSPQSNCDSAIRNFGDRLRSSALLGPKLKDIKVSQGFDRLDNQDVVSYEIDCVFKPEL